ncbi:DUF5610 domain-containing protein [Ectothiorhodospira lacustris]|uniref:DUF5610 domain-containing protein n=1 Tax=Ectothiorhodospira lacustris TaxID=2899127 RepID=UPI001EE928B5|nr:DUF5610 domain-containing protein [Ectothiorhodospira lacustris]MCG5522978.1 DUF5610 domain-containing protein [Ectothiorhodospira lacustris]
MVKINTPVTVLPSTPDFKTRNQGMSQAGGRTDNDSTRALSNLQNRILEALAKHTPGLNAAGFKQLKAEDYTPEKVSDRITQFVEMGLANARARGASEEQLQSMYDSAMKGVERGFKEAREILEGLNLLNGRIAEQVDETERLTLEGLTALAPNGQGQSLSSLTNLSVMQRYSRAESLELTLTTREGDKVTVQFQSATDIQARGGMSRDGDQSMQWLDVSRAKQSGYRFSVQGDLNAQELEAIENLVRDVSGLANEFFNGDVQKAFEMVPDLRFDSSQLASMDLSMTRVEQYSATARYQQTQQIEEGERARPGLRLGQLMREMQEQFNRSVLAFLDRPQEEAGRIMSALVQQDVRFLEAGESQQARFRENLERLLGALPRQEVDGDV